MDAPWQAWTYTWSPPGSAPIPFLVIVPDESHCDHVAWYVIHAALAQARR